MLHSLSTAKFYNKEKLVTILSANFYHMSYQDTQFCFQSSSNSQLFRQKVADINQYLYRYLTVIIFEPFFYL